MGGLVVLVLLIITPHHSSTKDLVAIDGALGKGRAFLSGSEWIGYKYNSTSPSECCTSCQLDHPSTEGFTYVVDDQKCSCYKFKKGATIRTKSYNGLESKLCGSSAVPKLPKTLFSEAGKEQGSSAVPKKPKTLFSDYGPGDEQVDGELCNRNCIKEPKDNKTCNFLFMLRQLFSDTPGRLADGMNRSVLVYNEVLPGPTIVVCEGDTVKVELWNKLTGDNEQLLGKTSKLPNSATTLHFHGIRAHMRVFYRNYKNYGKYEDLEGGALHDGVPMVTQCPVLPGVRYIYIIPGSGAVDAEYNNAPAGSYLYHSHMGAQRINGAAGKLIIMPREADTDRYDVDNPENSLILQEWHPSLRTKIAQTLLVNGKGKQDDIVYKCDDEDDEEACIENYKQGKKVHFTSRLKPPKANLYLSGDYGSLLYEPDYEVFNITKPGLRYRFRIIGAIGENIPIRISIENHKFTVISVDSVDIEPVPEFDALYVTAGERYDIVIHTKRNPRKNFAYKINVFHKLSDVMRCSAAWLKYPNQKVNKKYVASCTDMKDEAFKKVLNPVPNVFSRWGKSEDSTQTEYIYPVNLKSLIQEPRIESSLNTHYISMTEVHFNNIQMSFPVNYPDVPFLLQSPTNFTGRCGVKCDFVIDNPLETECHPIPDGFKYNEGSNQKCQHVIHQPLPPFYDPKKYWYEVVLINTHKNLAHPIHQHGGWFNIVGMDQFDESIKITRDKIMEMDTSCPKGKDCLPRNFDRPIHKDTIQVPTNGYVIFRVPMDNPGVTFMHCHINTHVEHGMAMVFQIGDSSNWHVNYIAKDEVLNKNCYSNPDLRKDW